MTQAENMDLSPSSFPPRERLRRHETGPAKPLAAFKLALAGIAR